MSIYDGVGQRFKERHDRLREALGTEVLHVESQTKLKAYVRQLAQNDFPLLNLEGDDSNVYELDPRILDLLPGDCAWKMGNSVVLPAEGDAKKDRFVIESVLSVYFQGVLVKKIALIYLNPKARTAKAP